ncbi:MAG: response regulator transcription factor [Clostridiales bacterium]|nr:response regulator transcription factor [Clostridiales bacterium]
MSDIRLLIADKDDSVRSQLKKLADNACYFYDSAIDGIMAIKLFRRHDYHLILMDTELPMLDGWNVCRQIRKVSEVPIIIVSANTAERDKLLAFELGADDYVCKPFSPSELLARIRVHLYRAQGIKSAAPSKISFSGLLIDTISRAVCVDDTVVKLTPKEYELLYFLSQNPNKAYSRESLLNEVWGYEFTGSDRTVDTHIKMLRENIKPYDSYIVTVWGFGYKFVM